MKHLNIQPLKKAVNPNSLSFDQKRVFVFICDQMINNLILVIANVYKISHFKRKFHVDCPGFEDRLPGGLQRDGDPPGPQGPAQHPGLRRHLRGLERFNGQHLFGPGLGQRANLRTTPGC